MSGDMTVVVKMSLAATIALAVVFAASSCAPAKTAIAVPEVDLVVYSSHPTDMVTMIIDEFRERTGLRVRVVQDGTGALLDRLRRGEAKDADVLWGGGAESLVANIDLFEAYRSPEREAIPATLRDEAGFWTGFTVLPMVIIFNARLIPESAVPKRWADLAAKSLAGSVAYADPAASGSSYTILRTMLVAGGAAAAGSASTGSGAGSGARSGPAAEKPGDSEAAWRFIGGFVHAIGGTPLAESALVYRGVAAGEYLVGVTYENAGAESQRLGSDVKIIYPMDGTSAVPDGVALIKGSTRGEAARAFIDFALGPDVARVVSERFKRRSARSDAAVPEGMPLLSSIRLLEYDFDAAVAERESTLQRFKALLDKANADSVRNR